MATKTTRKQAPSGAIERNAGATAPAASGTAQTEKASTHAAIEALKQDHRKVEKLFSEYESTDDESTKDKLVEQICIELIVHTKLEEEIFYPACRRALPDEEPLNEAQVEHDSAKMLIGDLLDADSSDPFRDAKVAVLKEQIRHHVAEEEKPKEGVFAQAAARGVDTADLAERLKERKEALQRRAAGLRPTRAVSFNPYSEKEDDMARYSSNDRERDEYGRFMSDDDDRGHRRPASRGGRSRYDDDDDDRGGRGHGRGGWFGDSEGHSRAARSRFDDDDDRRRSRYDDDDGRGHGRGGWFGDSEGHSRAARSRFDDDDDRGRRSRSRYDEDDDYDRRGRRRGGWFGDSEGHAEASRRGWDNPRHGPSGWYGDPDAHAEASRRGWDNPRHGPSGWYGDSEGHSGASRRGWDNPRHGSSGWYGDPEGHSEASRRGWDRRR